MNEGKDGSQNFHFQTKKVNQTSSSKFRSGNYSAEQATMNAAESKRLQAGDVTYEQNSHAAAAHEKVESNGVTAEKKAALLQEQRYGNRNLQSEFILQVKTAQRPLHSLESCIIYNISAGSQRANNVSKFVENKKSVSIVCVQESQT